MIHKAIYDLFAKRLRLSNPWNYKAPVLMGICYVAMLEGKMAWADGWVAFGASICTIVGIAGFGYLTNDLGDRRADLRAGKSNALAQMSNAAVGGMLLLFVALALLPWLLYFPVDARMVVGLSAEFMLFVLYVAPPFRLKERGLLGLVADALYAHALPAALAYITFLALAHPEDRRLSPIMIALVLWQFFLGLRNILLHQLKDAENDRRSGLRTYVTAQGESRAFALLSQWLVPLELLGFLLFLGAMTALTWLPLIAWPIYLLWRYPRARTSTHDLRSWLYAYLDDYYIGWLSLMVLGAACVQDWRFLGLAGAHLLLFKSAFSPSRDQLLKWMGGGK